MSDGAHPHLNRNELFNMTGFTAVVTGGGTGMYPLSYNRCLAKMNASLADLRQRMQESV